MRFAFLATGLLFVFGVGWLFSYDRHHIKFKSMAELFTLQIIISFFCLNTTAGIKMLNGISGFFGWLMEQAAGGINFVFGGLVVKSGSTVFFLNVLMPIVFISALIGILNYIKVLPFVIKWTGIGLNKIGHMGDLESYLAVSTAVLGQPEVYLTVLDEIPHLSEKRLYTICASGMSSVSASILASYMKLIPGKFVVVAVFLNILSALIVSCIINPYDTSKENKNFKVRTEKLPFFEMLGNYIMNGFQMAICVGAMLIGFVALVTFLNSTFTVLFHITFTTVIGYIFAPVAWIMGVLGQDIVKVGSLMAEKLIANEFVAMGDYQPLASGLTAKSQAIISAYMVSFANFGTLGTIIGSIRSISKEQASYVAKFAMRLLLGATLASILTGTIVGVYFN